MTARTISLPIARVRSTGLFATINNAFQLRAQRKSLAGLDDRALNDIGVDRAAAQREAHRSVWDVPANWLKPQSC